MSDYLPKYAPGDQVTIIASATITGGQLVTVAGAVATDASTTVAGVAGHDAVSGQPLTVIRMGIQRITASATITNGQPLCAAASGQVRPWVTGTDAVASYIGRAWSAAASTASCDVALYAV